MDEMQGVMSLPEAQGPGMRPEDMAIFEQIRQTIPRQEITKEFLDAGAQADPQAVAEFKQELAGLELTPDELNKLNTMVDAILAAPQDYASLRRAYLAEGIPEDLLPEQFDPAFFVALNMAIDTIAMNPGSPPPMAMAMGGVADLAAYGRNGDTMLAHITPQEAALLKRMGGSGTINPYTGLPEYFKIFKKIGKAIKKFAKSTVGKIIIGAALYAFAGPLAAGYLSGAAGSAGLAGVSAFLTSQVGIAAVSGFVAGAGSTLAAGGNLKQALKAGALGGVTAGAMSGISGALQGTNNFAPAPPVGPMPPSGMPAPIDNLPAPSTTAGTSSPLDPGLTGTSSPLDPGLAGTPSPLDPGLAGTPSPLDPGLTGSSNLDVLNQAAKGNLPRDMSFTGDSPVSRLSYTGSGINMPEGTQVASIGTPPAVPVQATPGLSTPGLGPPPPMAAGPAPAHPNAPAGFDISERLVGTNTAFSPGAVAGTGQQASEGVMDLIRQGEYGKAAGAAYDRIMPEALGGQRGVVTENMIKLVRPDAEKLITALRPDLALDSPEFSRLVSAQALKMATPSVLSTYGPLAALGIGALGVMGGFKPEQPQMPEQFKGPTGYQMYFSDPRRFGLYYGGTAPTSYGGQYVSRGYAQGGGVMDTPQAMRVGGKTYPRKIGSINGPGTGTSDSIPAMLSDGEFVFTAKAVRAMGNGSRRKGAKKMYQLMKMLEGKSA